MVSWVYLAIGIFVCILGNIFIKYSHGFEKMGWGVSSLVLYTFANIAFGMAVKDLPLSIAYSVWIGFVSVSVVIAGIFLFEENISLIAGFLMAFIMFASIGLVLVTKS